MYRFLLLLFLSVVYINASTGQVIPKEDSKLNYRIIGFSVPVVPQITKYKIEIAEGNFTDEQAFERNIVVVQENNSNRQIVEVPSFGAKYTWRVTSMAGKLTRAKSPFYHFSIGTIPQLDTSLHRFRVIAKPKKYADAYVFLDCNKALYDMNGLPVWYLPDVTADAVDLKISPFSTITFLAGNHPNEVDYNGHVLWPRDDGKASDIPKDCHHEFTRLSNGHYMVFSNEKEYWKLPAAKDSIALNAADSSRFYQVIFFGALVEIDQDQHIVWSWHSSKYVKESDLIDLRTPDGKYDLDVHGNSFVFDEKNKTIDISFRAISRIIRIDYPSGKVLNTYGTLDESAHGNQMFCNQHSVKLSEKGLLYFFNNNLCKAPFTPQVIVAQEPPRGAGTLKKVWEYNCTVEDPSMPKGGKLQFKRGGNVVELPDESFFVAMCDPFSKVFIVNRKKEILWSAIPENLNLEAKTWKSATLYRASIITSRKELERLIWNSER